MINHEDIKGSLEFIKKMIGWQREVDHTQENFEHLIELYADVEKCLNDETKIMLRKKVIRGFEKLSNQMYTAYQGKEDDLRVENYENMKKVTAIKPTELVVSKNDGQLKLVGKHGGYRKGAGRKKLDKESRAHKIALDESTWIFLEGFKETEELEGKKLTWTALLSELIERGIDRK